LDGFTPPPTHRGEDVGADQQPVMDMEDLISMGILSFEFGALPNSVFTVQLPV
jgi:hypothetical protein